MSVLSSVSLNLAAGLQRGSGLREARERKRNAASTALCFSPAVFISVLFIVATTMAGRADAAKAETTPVMPAATSGSDFRTAVEKRTFELVNDYRRENGFDALAWNEAIAKIARAHSKDMATGAVDFGHAGFGDRVREMKSVLPGFSGVGENVLYTSNLDEVAKGAVTLWLHSPHHLANIRGDYSQSGLGVWQKDDGTLYFTQLFVKVAKASE